MSKPKRRKIRSNLIWKTTPLSVKHRDSTVYIIYMYVYILIKNKLYASSYLIYSASQVTKYPRLSFVLFVDVIPSH